jgi:CDP-diacylglycerol---glycerol-3-phosphate 3-phosphatidyltransferase
MASTVTGGQPTKTFRFGPSAVMTPANAITIARLLATPVLVVMVALWGATWSAVVVAFCVCSTDGLDGWIARRQGATTSGAFLDPLADKAVIVGTFAVLAAKGEIMWAPVVLITAREVWMSLYRSFMSRRSISIPARPSAKAKTLVQDLVLGLCLLPPVAHHHTVLVDVAVWFAAALTIVTGVQYLVDGRRLLGSASAAPTGAPAPSDSAGTGQAKGSA